MSVRITGSATQYVWRTAADGGVVDFSTTDYTFAFWVRTRAAGTGWHCLQAIFKDGGDRYDIFESGDGGFQVGTHLLSDPQGTFEDDDFSHALTTDTWYYVAMTRTGGTLKGYIIEADDTVNTVTRSDTKAHTTASDRMEIGGYTDYGEYVDIEVAYVRVWTHVLTQAELVSESNSNVIVHSANVYANDTFYTTTDIGEWNALGSISNGAANPPPGAPPASPVRTATSIAAALSQTARRTAASVVAALRATRSRAAASVVAVLSQGGTYSRTAASVVAALLGTRARSVLSVKAAIRITANRSALSVVAVLSSGKSRTAATVTTVLSILPYTSVERKTGVGGVYAEIAKVYPPETEYDDPGPFVYGTTYYYRARTCDEFGNWSDYSAETSVTWYGLQVASVVAALSGSVSRGAASVVAALRGTRTRTASLVTAALSSGTSRTAALVVAVLGQLGIARTAQTVTATLASRFGRPESDVSTGNWTTAPLWSKVDEE